MTTLNLTQITAGARHGRRTSTAVVQRPAGSPWRAVVVAAAVGAAAAVGSALAFASTLTLNLPLA